MSRTFAASGVPGAAAAILPDRAIGHGTAKALAAGARRCGGQRGFRALQAEVVADRSDHKRAAGADVHGLPAAGRIYPDPGRAGDCGPGPRATGPGGWLDLTAQARSGPLDAENPSSMRWHLTTAPPRRTTLILRPAKRFAPYSGNFDRIVPAAMCGVGCAAGTSLNVPSPF